MAFRTRGGRRRHGRSVGGLLWHRPSSPFRLPAVEPVPTSRDRSRASPPLRTKTPYPACWPEFIIGEYLRGTQNGTAHRRLRFSELLETLCRSRARRPRSATIRLAATVVTRKGSRASGIIAQPESIFWLWQCDKENYGWCEGRPLTVAAKFRSGRERRCRWKMRDVWLEDYVEHYNDVNEYEAAGC